MGQEPGPGKRGAIVVKTLLRLLQIGALQGLRGLLSVDGEGGQKERHHGAEQDKVPPKQGKSGNQAVKKLTHILTSFRINVHYKT